MRKIRERPRAFIDLFCTPGQPCYMRLTDAALAAGYGKGNRKHANQHAGRMKNDPDVKREIDARIAENERDLKARSVAWAEETERQAMADIGDLFDEDGHLLPVKKIPEHVRRAIASIEVERRTEGKGEDAQVFYIHKIKLHDKKASQELLLKYAGKLKEQMEHSGDVTIQIIDPYAKPK